MNDYYGTDYSQNDWRLYHHGVKGQKWGVRNGPPYPLKRSHLITEAIDRGEILVKINNEKQARHIKGSGYIEGRSYLLDNEDPQKLLEELSTTGRANIDKNGNWAHTEDVKADHYIGYAVDLVTGNERLTKEARIHYSNTGSHIVPHLRKR